MVTLVDNENSENHKEMSNSKIIVPLTTIGNVVDSKQCRNLDTVSVYSDCSNSSSDSSDIENLVTDGALITPPELCVPRDSRVNIINSSDVHVGNVVHNHGPVTINKQLTIKDLEENSSEIQLESQQSNCDNTKTENNNCDNKLGNSNPAFVPENNCDNQIKTAKLDDGLFIITNKNIALEDSVLKKILIRKKACSFRKIAITSSVLILVCGSILFMYKNSQISEIPGIHTAPNNEILKDQRSILLLVSPLAILLLICVLVGSILVYKNINQPTYNWGQDTDEQENNTPIDGTNNTIPGPEKLRLISRLEWLAQPPEEESNKLNLPVPMIIIHHTATVNCTTRAQCVFQCRQIQTYHIESNKWWDIGYNFLVGGDGLAYEGRGFYKEGAHTFSYNSKSIGIAFIGTFNQYRPPAIQIKAAQRLIEKAENMGILTKSYKILGARQFSRVESPGQKLYEEIQTWPHWSSENKN